MSHCQTECACGAKGPAIRNPLAAVPVKPDCVELKRDSAGRIHLRLNAPPKGLGGRIARLVGYDYTRKLELDEYGSFYYSLVDGANSLDVIIGRMADRFRKGREAMEANVILFTKKLMVMNMIALKVPSDDGEAA